MLRAGPLCPGGKPARRPAPARQRARGRRLPPPAQGRPGRRHPRPAGGPSGEASEESASRPRPARPPNRRRRRRRGRRGRRGRGRRGRRGRRGFGARCVRRGRGTAPPAAARRAAAPQRRRRRRARSDSAASASDDGADEATSSDERQVVEGAVELLANGSGFLRLSPPDPTDDDVYISAAQVKRCELVSGDMIGGPVRAAAALGALPVAVRVDTINGRPADEVAEGTRFEDLPVRLAGRAPRARLRRPDRARRSSG